jgi:phenylalanyl-tRNA synthetase beta chain
LGYSEAVNLSFAGASEEARFSSGGPEPATIRNPLTEETRLLRATLADGLIKTVRRNLNHGLRIVRLFEIGKVYFRDKEGQLRERNMLGVVGTGGFAGQNWRNPEGEYDFFHLKGALTTLLRGIRSAPFDIEPSSDAAWLSPACSAALLAGGKKIGVLGSLHPDLAEEHKFKQPVFLAELDFEELSRTAFMPVQYEALPKYPSAERDLSVVIARDISYGTLRKGILGLGIRELVSIELIDVYEGDKIPADKISVTIRLTFQDKTRTLTVDQVQAFSDNVVHFLTASYDAQLR